MTHILTLIASTSPLSIAHIERAEKFIEANGIGMDGAPAWLAPHVSADIGIANPLSMEQMKDLRAVFDADRVDVLCVPRESRRKKLLLADMDATIVEGETLDELAARAGLKDKIASITAQGMRGEIDFKDALKMRVALLKGLPVSALQETLHETVLCQGAKEMIAGMREARATCVLVSGGFTHFTKSIAAQCGFHHHHGNVLEHDGEVLSGSVAEPILDKDSKLALLKSYTAQMGIDLADTIAVGDGANDLPMLAAAGIGIGYRPKPLLEENLLNILKYADLRGVLYAQGMD
jgi:phosphoserine phosphatase